MPSQSAKSKVHKCRSCGCTERRACWRAVNSFTGQPVGAGVEIMPEDQVEYCAWANTRKDVCTACDGAAKDDTTWHRPNARFVPAEAANG